MRQPYTLEPRAEVYRPVRYRGEFILATPAEGGGDHTWWIMCDHEHRTPEQATECGRKMARKALDNARRGIEPTRATDGTYRV